MRWKIEVTEIDRINLGGAPAEQTVYTQVVGTNPIKAIQKALVRERKPKEKPAQGKPGGK